MTTNNALKELANRLRVEVIPREKAELKARNSTTDEIIHRLETEDLSPPLSIYEIQAYANEARKRLRNE